MAGIQAKATPQKKDADKPLERTKYLELSTQAHDMDLAPEMLLSQPIPGNGISNEPGERLAALVSDPRFLHSANGPRRAQLMNELQGSHGNAHVQRLLSSRAVQAKLTINQPDDQYEREADRVAAVFTKTQDSQIQRDAIKNEEKEEVVPMSSVGNHVSDRIQRQAEEEEEEEEEEETVQMKADSSRVPEVSQDLETRINAARGSGHTLPDSLRASLEPRLQHDFSRVRIHTDAEADKLAQQLEAKAFTAGKDVFFRGGAYQPNSTSGRSLIGHELAHVVQQGAGRVSRQPAETEVAQEKEKEKGKNNGAEEVQLSWWQEALLETAGVDPKLVMRLFNKAGGAIKAIFSDPGKFVNTLVKAVGLGFRQFADNIGKHLAAGFMQWLFGTMSRAGIELPKDFSPKSILQLVLQVLGITVEKIKEKITNVIGTKHMRRLEKAWEILTTFMKEGIGGLWEMLEDYFSDLKDTIIEQIKSWLITEVVVAAITKIVGMFNPVSGLINIVKMIYNVIVFLIEKARQIIQLFSAIADSVYELAMGDVKKAADKIEQTLASLIPIAIGFLASLLGIGGLADKIKEIIKSIQARVDKALDQVIGKVANTVRKVIGKGREAFAESRAGKLYGRGKAKAEELYGRGKEMYKMGKAKAQQTFEKAKAKAGEAVEKAAGKAGLVPGKKQEPADLIAAVIVKAEPSLGAAEKIRAKITSTGPVTLAELEDLIKDASPAECKNVWSDSALMTKAELKLGRDDYLEFVTKLGVHEEPTTPVLTEGGREHTPAPKADEAIRDKLDRFVKGAIAAGKNIAGLVSVVAGEDWDTAGERRYGHNVWHNGPPPKRPKGNAINGFVDSRGRVWIHHNRGNPGTMIHEGIHKYSNLTLKNQFGQQINEGITEYFTRIICRDLNISRGNYQRQWEVIDTVVSNVASEEIVATAYFDGKIMGLKWAYIDYRMNKKREDLKLARQNWDDFVKQFKAEDFALAKSYII